MDYCAAQGQGLLRSYATGNRSSQAASQETQRCKAKEAMTKIKQLTLSEVQTLREAGAIHHTALRKNGLYVYTKNPHAPNGSETAGFVIDEHIAEARAILQPTVREALAIVAPIWERTLFEVVKFVATV